MRDRWRWAQGAEEGRREWSGQKHEVHGRTGAIRTPCRGGWLGGHTRERSAMSDGRWVRPRYRCRHRVLGSSRVGEGCKMEAVGSLGRPQAGQLLGHHGCGEGVGWGGPQAVPRDVLGSTKPYWEVSYWTRRLGHGVRWEGESSRNHTTYPFTTRGRVTTGSVSSLWDRCRACDSQRANSRSGGIAARVRAD